MSQPHPTSHATNAGPGASVLPSKMDSRPNTRNKGTANFDVFSEWRKGVDPNGLESPSRSASRATASGTSRDVLASVRTNVSKAPANTKNASQLPSPALGDAKALLNANVNASRTAVSVLSEKRPASGTAPPIVSKRAKLAVTEASLEVKTIRMEEEKWSAKWVKAFPNLVFHFEIGAEEGGGKALRSRVIKMGAKVEQFFSTRVTHLIVKGGNTPQSKSRNTEALKNPFVVESTGPTDLIEKAEAMNMKVWPVKKLSDILARIAPIEKPVPTDSLSLSTLLEEERLHGTRERDLTAPRPDFYYFKPNNKFLLIEDATGKHRTIMVKEYTHRDGPDWPTLHSGFLRVPSSYQSPVPVSKLRERAIKLLVERQPYLGEQPPSSLKRSASLSSMPSTPKLPEAQPYQDASGNSVVITSNIASTSTPNTPHLAGGLPTLGSNRDRALVQMSKRVQVLKGNANARIAASKQEAKDSVFSPAGASAPKALPGRRHSTGHTDLNKKFESQESVIKMLKQAREPVQEDPIPAAQRIRNREKVEMGLKGRDQDTAAGYCENCRLKYADLSVHMVSKKHRRFALNDENFASLDRLLGTLERPAYPKYFTLEYPPCYQPHPKDWDCDLCNGPQFQEGSESGPGESGESGGSASEGESLEDSPVRSVSGSEGTSASEEEMYYEGEGDDDEGVL
ncbi:hypothetical protein IAT38_007171 [Cryptococcus sp. DSM 104549]